MKVFFDHNVPHKLRYSIEGHQVTTADEMGWSQLENGELIAVAEQSGFHAMITADQNLVHQQNWTGRKLALIVLDTNNWNLIKEDTQVVGKALAMAKPGSVQIATFGHMRRKPRGRA